MKKFNTTPISGMQELLPARQADFNQLKQEISEAFRRHGFQNIETPTIERTEVLLAKAGGETEKQIYKVIKTAETAAESDQALRFDHTVPLARYTVEHMNNLAFPFKVSQIGRNFRGERPQKGRFREFYQCDVDVIGRDELPLDYDADVIATLADALRRMELPGEVQVRVSNRKLLSGMLAELNLEAQAGEIFAIVDHAEKVPAEKTVAALEEIGLGSENVVKITTFIEIAGAIDEVLPKLADLGFENATFRAGMQELEAVIRRAEQMKPQAEVIADMKIVRGLDYYTGTVFESILKNHREIGSICSGGRYENLAGNYTEQKLPGVGGSIGLTRLFSVLQDCDDWQRETRQPVEYCIVQMDENEKIMQTSLDLAEKLRNLDHVVDVIWGEKKLGQKIKHAAKIADKLIVIGENEAAQPDNIEVKDLVTGEKETLMV